MERSLVGHSVAFKTTSPYKINSARGAEQLLYVFGRADVRMFLLELAVGSALVLRIVVNAGIGGRRDIIKSRSKGVALRYGRRILRKKRDEALATVVSVPPFHETVATNSCEVSIVVCCRAA
jgi:hypothetical protein